MAMLREGQLGVPRLGGEGGNKVCSTGPGCYWCLAVLFTSLEHLPLRPALPLMLSGQPQGWRVSPSASLGREGGGRPGCGLKTQTCTYGRSKVSPKPLLFICLVVLVPENGPGSGMHWNGRAAGSLAGQGLWVVSITTAQWSNSGCFAIDLSSLRALSRPRLCLLLGAGC